MRKNIFFNLFFVLAVLAGLMLSSCGEGLEEGIGTITLTNNSTNVVISYWSLEQSDKETVWETHSPIDPGSSASHQIDSGIYKIYLEDTDGDGWLTKTTYTVRKDKTVVVKFPSDFNVERSIRE